MSDMLCLPIYDARHTKPISDGWYLVYAPRYKGSRNKQSYNGFCIAFYKNGKWAIERAHGLGLVEYWSYLNASLFESISK